ncbi:MAG: hypothetical protein PHQ12_00910 [Chthoniobacteraceae bacterium]|nr:hypothetical protein [Chthoniobacteraceae bacterium]
MQPCLFFAVLLPLLICSTLIGRALTARVPPRLRGICRLYLSPAAGAAVLVCMSILYGWLTGGGGSWLPWILVGLATVGGFALDPDRRGMAKHLALVCAFGILASWPVAAQIWRFELINPYNDTFTYLGHAQWLQEHSFREPANPDYHPLWTQVLIYQNQDFRMGASFFLAWVQRLAGAKWALDVFPAAAAFAMALAGLAFAGGLAVAAKARPAWALAGGLLLPWTLNGLCFAAVLGFFPQCYGMAFALAGMLLWGMILDRCGAGGAPFRGRMRWLAALAALLLATSVHAYTEFVPFLGLACFLSWAWALAVRRAARGALVRAGLFTAGGVFLLVNLEWLRAVHALRTQSGITVGTSVPWSILQFWTHSAGWKQGFVDGKISMVPFPWLAALVTCVLLAAAFYGILRQFRRGSSLVLTPQLALFSALLAAFFYFRYGVPSPWGEGVGQTWNQFKLCEWASPAFLLIAWAVLIASTRRSRLARRALALALAATLAIGGSVQFQKAQERTSPPFKSAGSNFAAFRKLEAEVRGSVRPEEIVFLTSEYVKPKQIASLFLYRYRIVGDWSKDEYVYPVISEELRGIPLSRADWVINGKKHDKETPASWSLSKNAPPAAAQAR